MYSRRIFLICTLFLGIALLAGCSGEGPVEPRTQGVDLLPKAAENPAIPKTPGDDPVGTDANDGMVPFRGTYTTEVSEAGFIPPTTALLDLWGEGYATHLGKTTWYSLSYVDVITGAQSGSTVEIAANGDEFHYDYLGGSVLDEETGTYSFWGDWVVTGGTGRFAGATGGGTYEGTATGTQGTGQITLIGEISRPNRNEYTVD